MSSPNGKDFSTDLLLHIKSEEKALEKPTKRKLEEISGKNSNFNAGGPGSIPEAELNTLESNVGNNSSLVKGADDLSNPKNTNNIPQGPTDQNPPKSASIASNTSCKEAETDSQWIILDTVPDFMKYKICSSVFESPQLLSCCGTNICKKCMDRHLQRLATLADQQPLCPFCRSTNFKLINNTALEQSINQLKVQCCYQHRGCDWTGILGGGNLHLKECDFAPINCPNGCDYEQFECCRLPDHLLVCPHTYTTCSFETIGCDAKVPILHQAAQKHGNDYHDVSKHLLLVAQRNIQLLKDHRHFCTSLQSESCVSVANDELVISQTETVASTKYTFKSLKDSLQEIQQKIATLKEELRNEEIYLAEIKKRVGQMKNTEAIYKESIAQICILSIPQATGKSYPPVTFTVDNFRKRIKLNDVWLSPPFYTHIGGYKMCLSVHPNSHWGTKHSVSVNIHFMAGEFDEHLMWPFPGAIFTITTINQHPNKCNRSVNLELVGKDTIRSRSKPDGGLGLGYDSPKLLHSDLAGFLSRDNCFMLMMYRIQFLPL